MKIPYRCKISTQHIDDIKAAELTGEPVYHRKWKTTTFDLAQVESYYDSFIKIDAETELPVCSVGFKSGDYMIVNKTYESFDEDFCKYMIVTPVNINDK